MRRRMLLTGFACLDLHATEKAGICERKNSLFASFDCTIIFRKSKNMSSLIDAREK